MVIQWKTRKGHSSQMQWKIVEGGTNRCPCIHKNTISQFGTSTVVESVAVSVVLWAFLLNEVLR